MPIVITKGEVKSVPKLESYIGKDLDSVIEEMEKTGFYNKYYSRDGIKGYQLVTMIRYSTRIEIVAKSVSEDKREVLDVFAYNISEKTEVW